MSVVINSPADNSNVSGVQNISVTSNGHASTELWIDPYSPPGVSVSKAFPNHRNDYYLRPNVGLARSIGFTESAQFNGSRTTSANNPFPTSTNRWVLNLENYRTRDLDASIINKARGTFENARTNGVKIVFHICYAFGFRPSGWQEPSLAQIESHLADLQDLLEEYKDVISSICFGLLGAWGECFKAIDPGPAFVGNCSEAFQDAVKDLLLEYLPANLHIMHRYLRVVYDQSGDDWIGWYTAPITQAEAYGQTGGTRWRFGHHFDSWAYGGYQGRRYGHEGGSKWPESVPTTDARIEAQEAYIRQTNKWCPNYLEGGIMTDFFVTHPGWDNRTQMLHYLYDRSPSNINYYAQLTKPYLWLGGNDAESALWRRTVGYLLWLKNFDLTVNDTQVIVSMNWENLGSCGLHWKYPMWLDLGGQMIKLSDDIRMETPRGQGTMNGVTYTKPRPSNLGSGPKAVKLWIPDDSSRLVNDARYSIPLDSIGATFDSGTGRNDLGLTIGL
jgi:hypothetical protein